jgi:hypothetical protein
MFVSKSAPNAARLRLIMWPTAMHDEAIVPRTRMKVKLNIGPALCQP